MLPFRSYRSLLFKFWTLLRFRATLLGLETAYDVYLGLIGKRVIDFLLVPIELFFARCYGRGTTGEYRSKIGDFAPTRSL